MDLTQLQREVGEWSRMNFGEKLGEGHRPLLGIVEEVGELCHAHLKAEQGIRTNEDHREAKGDAIGDILIYLADYCEQQGFNMQVIMETVWKEVRQRDWTKNKETGL